MTLSLHEAGNRTPSRERLVHMRSLGPPDPHAAAPIEYTLSGGIQGCRCQSLIVVQWRDLRGGVAIGKHYDVDTSTYDMYQVKQFICE